MRRALKLVSQGAVVSQVHNPNRNVFNNRLNCPRLSHSLKLSGNVFHRRGPAAAKHRSPKLLYVRQTTHFGVSAEWSRRALASAASWQSSAR